MKIKTTTLGDIKKEILKAVVGSTMQIEFIDFFRDTKFYRAELKTQMRTLYGMLRNHLKAEAKDIGGADEGVYNILLDAQWKSVESLGKLSVDSMVGISNFLESVAELEKDKVKYKLNIEILTEEVETKKTEQNEMDKKNVSKKKQK